MKIIVSTSDKHIQFLEGFVYMFNKYWPYNAEVTVVGYSPPSFDLPDNFEFVSVGKQSEYGKEWTTALIPYFKQLPDEYFILMVEDFYILGVDESLLHKAEKHMIEGIEKIHLIHFNGRSETYEKDINFDIYKQNATYRLSLQPAFIRRDHLLKYLVPGKDIREYETTFEAPMNDGAQILVPKRDIVPIANVVTVGRLWHPQIAKIKKEDLDAIKQLGIL